MKRITVIAALLLCTAGLKAQECDAIMLPYFHNNRARMEEYKAKAPDKFDYRCTYARAAFYESDTIPAGVDVFCISEVKNVFTGESLPTNFVVNLNTLSYYSYDFSGIQMRHPSGSREACFSTPGSAHPYLVLRTIDYMTQEAMSVFNK